MILLFSLFGLFGQNKKKSEINLKNFELKSGQIWKYNTRKGEEKSRIIILRVEKYDKGEIVVHIAVKGLKIENSQKESGISEEIGHLPFSNESIIKSLTELESSNNDLPDYLDGYNEWKKAFDSGKGGMFTISINEAVDFVEQSMNQ
ncbi:hypothetical protein [Lutibacter flavus]|uniref:Uncharacterized protein n=1 Tax=Lutibacter flavus TaxID=691689 RepID=A0A238VKF1_9FLAO|nr:hypothetical protein [Lutibacter flavus]SNR34654.1 hypothetical protein SAMN04488111_0621 [Lutibacter flavus]